MADIPEPVPGTPTTADEVPRLAPEETERLRALCNDALSSKAVKVADRPQAFADHLQAQEDLNAALAEQWLRGVSSQRLADELNFLARDKVVGRVLQACRQANRA